MTTPKAARKSKKTSPRSAARKRLRDLVKHRGHRIFNIWYVYSPKLGRDWVLDSDLAYDHFTSLEANLEVVFYDLDPPPVIVKVGDDDHKTTFDAKVVFKNGKTEYREVKYADEVADATAVRTQHQLEAQAKWLESQNASYCVITEEVLLPERQRIMNWRRIISAMARARYLNIDVIGSTVATVMSSRLNSTISELLQSVPQPERPRWLAAIFRLIQQVVLTSDLDVRPLSGQTAIGFLGRSK